MKSAALVALLAIPWFASAATADRAVAEEALDAWDIERASASAEAMQRASPDDPDVLDLLARVRMHQGRYDEAVELFSRAGADTDSGGYLALAKATARLTRNYAQVESPHFVFRFPRGKDEVLAPYALETLERAYDRIGEAVGARPDGKIIVEVVQDATELSQVSTLSLKAIKTTGTIAICKFNKLIITSPKALMRGYEWRDTLAHELTHLLVTKKSRNHTPIWLHEGIAKYFETAWRGPPGRALEPPSQALLRDAVKADKLITFEQMHPSIALLPNARAAELAFAEVFVVIEFLHGKNPQSVDQILTALAGGKSDREAVASVFGQPFPKFEAAWRKYLRTRKYPEGSPRVESLELELREDPDRPDVKRGEGYRAFTGLGQFSEIADPTARRAAHLGELLRARSKPAAAAAKFREALDRTGPSHAELANKYAMTMLELQHPGEAMQVLEASHAIYPNDPLTNLNLARASMHLGKMGEAQPFLEQSLSVNPFDPEVHERLLVVAKARGDEPLKQRAERALAVLRGKADAAPDATAEKEVIGWLAIESDVLARALIDGADSGMTTPIARLPVGPGTHRVRLERLDGPGAKEFEVEVRPGETTDLRAALVGS